MLRYLLVIPLLLVLIFLSVISVSEGIALFSGSVVLFALLSLAYLEYACKRIQVRIDFPMKTAQRDQTVRLQVKTKNQTALELERLVLIIQYRKNASASKEKKKLILYDVPKVECVRTEKLNMNESGFYEFSIKKAYVYDFFGLFYRRVRVTENTGVLVLPTIEEVPVYLGEGVKQFYGDSSVYDENHPGADPSETFEIREFRQGDKLQRVHWKISARTDELMVKESSLPKACAVVLFMPGGDKNSSKCVDYMASLSFTLMDLDCPHYVVWYSESRSEVTRFRVDDEETFYTTMVECLKDCAPTPEDLIESYREKYRGQAYLHSVSLASKDTISIDSQTPVPIEELYEEIYLR